MTTRTSEFRFGTLEAGRYWFFVSAQSQSVPSGVYQLHPAMGGKTYMVDGNGYSATVTSSPAHITGPTLLLGLSLGIQPNGTDGRFELRQTASAFTRFMQRMSKVEHPEATLCWYDKGF